MTANARLDEWKIKLVVRSVLSRDEATMLSKRKSHAFKMIGRLDDVMSRCKSTLSTSGFSDFSSYGNSFACYRQPAGHESKLMIFVEFEAQAEDVWEVSFQKFETGVPSVQRQLMHVKLDRIQKALEPKVDFGSGLAGIEMTLAR